MSDTSDKIPTTVYKLFDPEYTEKLEEAIETEGIPVINGNVRESLERAQRIIDATGYKGVDPVTLYDTWSESLRQTAHKTALQAAMAQIMTDSGTPGLTKKKREMLEEKIRKLTRD